MTDIPWPYQVVSDLHSECMTPAELEEALKTLQPTAPLLILAGDIGNLVDMPSEANLQRVLDHCSRLWECVIYVLGNHEYYLPKDQRLPWKSPSLMTLAEADEVYGNLVSHWPNITLLSAGQFVMYKGVVLLGCTLWADISSIPNNLWGKLRDSRYAKRGEIISRYQYESQWLKDTIKHQRELGRPLMVITHFPPVGKSTQGWSSYFTGDLITTLDEDYLPKVWIYGHSHQAGVQQFKNCWLVSCPWEEK